MNGTMVSTVEEISIANDTITIEPFKCGTISDDIDDENTIYEFNTIDDGYVWGNDAITTSVNEFSEIQKIRALLLSLSSKISAIENQLNVLQVNRGIEEEWDELAKIKEQYEKKEKEILEKIAIMKNLKEGHEQ